ncbi:MAG: DNA repair protein RecN [Ferruginibacter sp.]
MLKKLHIRNYAIIEEVSIDFSAHLNIITGETGAGKSILMGALNLILGDRFDSASLHSKEKKCIVEAFFETKGNNEIADYLKANDLDNDDDLNIRREVAPNGKSRAFINDTPVNLNQLKSLAGILVDLHQQFDTMELGSNAFQQQVLDAVAENNDLIKAYVLVYQQYYQALGELKDLLKKKQEADAAIDYNRFLFDELDAASLKEGEIEKAEAELKLLNNAENIKIQLEAVCFELNESEQPIVQQLKTFSSKLRSLAGFHPDINLLSERLEAALVEVKDIAGEAERIKDEMQYDAERLQYINDRLSMGYKLLKKHNVQATADLITLREELAEKLAGFINIEDTILAKEKATRTFLHKCEELAAQISAKRKKAAEPFAKNVNVLLKQVGMPNAQVKVSIEKGELSSNGFDEIEFLFDANKSNQFEPLRKVASGGELSRLMLCIKSLVAQKLRLPTLIFDEIDTGISGEAAKQVGIIMKKLSLEHQVISITHQPQIAARADAHYYVYKTSQANGIKTSIKILSEEERIVAIAQMLGGEKPTAAAIENAREMVYN